MALLLAARAPEKELDEFISSVLMEEDNFEQAGGCNWAPPPIKGLLEFAGIGAQIGGRLAIAGGRCAGR
eukprot:4476675-Pleurochrysis_carterae.AAC.1